jgi:hypothetical protein
MKIKDLIQKLAEYDPEMEITVMRGDSILGDYQLCKDLYFNERTGGLDTDGCLWDSISNYYDEDMKKETVLCLD